MWRNDGCWERDQLVFALGLGPSRPNILDRRTSRGRHSTLLQHPLVTFNDNFDYHRALILSVSLVTSSKRPLI